MKCSPSLPTHLPLHLQKFGIHFDPVKHVVAMQGLKEHGRQPKYQMYTSLLKFNYEFTYEFE